MEFVTDMGMPAMHSTFWIPLSKEEISIDIDMSHVIICTEAPTDLSQFYTNSMVKIKQGDTEESKKLIEEKVKNAIKQFTKHTSNTSSWTMH